MRNHTDRIGGRVQEVPFGSVNVELGANWVHFSNNNIFKEGFQNQLDEMVDDAGLDFVKDYYDDIIYRCDN